VVASDEPRRALLLELLRAALEAVDGRRRTRLTLERLVVGRDGDAALWAVAIGKAASCMALGARDALGDRLERVLIITKDGHVDAEALEIPGGEIRESSHPIPDRRSLEAGARLLEFIGELPAGTRPLFLVSGGASSLAEVLMPGVSLEALRQLNEDGLAGGLAIETLNERRRRVSRIKGGRLASMLSGRRALALFVSDVAHDDPAVIGSGLLGPAAEGAGSDDVERIVIASLDDALEAVRARAAGLTASVQTERFSGAVDRLAVRFAHETVLGPMELRAWGGESTIRLPVSPGRGGRNQHLALAAARLIAGREDVFLLAAGTDGTDGPTDDAGALVDGETCARAAAAGFDVDDCLRCANSGAALAAAGDLVHTGPTGTNVGDLVVGLQLSASAARVWLHGRSGP